MSYLAACWFCGEDTETGYQTSEQIPAKPEPVFCGDHQGKPARPPVKLQRYWKPCRCAETGVMIRQVRVSENAGKKTTPAVCPNCGR